MALASALLDICRFNPTTGGTTDWTYSSAVTGYQSPALAGVVNGVTYSYRAESNDLSQWEIGTGAYNTGTGVLARTAVLYNSSGTGTGTGQSGAGTKINFSTTPQVAIVALGEDLTSAGIAKSFLSAGCVGDGTTDDTTAFQALLTANPSNAVLDGQGRTYKITSAVTIPASSTYLKIQNANFTVSGDINFLSVASGTATFFEMDTVLITASGQTTAGRICVDVSRMANFTFRKVWINATANKSYCWYGAGTGGASPYYGVWDHCYAGNFNIGIFCQDNGTPSAGVNSNTIYCCRLQPQTGNFGIYLGQNSQNINVIGCDLESTGGTGIYMDGTGHLIEGTRFESQTTGISVTANCTNSEIGLNYFSSNTTSISYAGSSRLNNIVLYDPGAVDYIDTGSTTQVTSATITVTIATPAVVTWTGHNFTVGGATTAVKFSTTGALPTGITAGTTYYLKAINANTFNIATSAANALAGTFIATSGSQSGVHTGSNVISLATTVKQDMAALTVPAGDWDISGQGVFAFGGTTTVNSIGSNITLVSATADTTFGRRTSWEFGYTPNAFENTMLNTGPARFTFSTATTVFLCNDANFGTSTTQTTGWLRARRAHL